jgi:uncharacterized protein involved in type VI secretion and phage assembly
MSLSVAGFLSQEPRVRPWELGVVVGIVTNNNDPDKLGRVKVRFPWLNNTDESDWARVLAPMAGKGRGTYFLPEVDDEVLLVFDRGDLRVPYVIGSLWNGKDTAPAGNEDGKNNVRMIKSRSGHTIKLNDEKGKETIEIVDASGENSVVIDTAANTLTIKAKEKLVLIAGKSIELQANTIVTQSDADTSIKAKGNMAVEASAKLKVAGSQVDIN